MDLHSLFRRMDAMAQASERAMVAAMNDAGFKGRTRWQEELRARFDRVTPFVIRSVWVDRATDQKPGMRLALRDYGERGAQPEQVVYPHVEGGRRKLKRFERALQRAGLMSPGLYAVPGTAAPRDAYGNVPGSFIQRLLSYLQAFSEQGHKANMTAKSRARMAKVSRSASGYKRIGGVEYFVSHGPGERQSARGSRQQHLVAGIWSRAGTHGSDVRPIFLFVAPPTYRQRINLDAIRDHVHREFQTASRVRWNAAMRRLLG